MRRNTYALVAAAMAIGLAGAGCSSSGSDNATTSAISTSTSTSAAASATTAGGAPVDSSQLPTLIPTPAGSAETKGPDSIADNGIHMYFKVNGTPADTMAAYKAALEAKGWAVTTVVTSTGDGRGGATYTGTHGDAYGVFDGGGYETNTYINVCAWPTKPANPNCARD